MAESGKKRLIVCRGLVSGWDEPTRPSYGFVASPDGVKFYRAPGWDGDMTWMEEQAAHRHVPGKPGEVQLSNYFYPTTPYIIEFAEEETVEAAEESVLRLLNSMTNGDRA